MIKDVTKSQNITQSDISKTPLAISKTSIQVIVSIILYPPIVTVMFNTAAANQYVAIRISF